MDAMEKPDHFSYQNVSFWPDILRFFISALRYCAGRFENEQEVIRNDEILRSIFSDEILKSMPISKEIARLKRIADYLEGKINEAPNALDYDLTIDHGIVRLLKSVGLAYLGELRDRRDRLSIEQNLTPLAAKDVDTILTKYQETLGLGIFRDATPFSLLIEVHGPYVESLQHRDDQIRDKQIQTTSYAGIDLIDQPLRERCLDLFTQFDKDGQTERFDTVVAEATKVLEDRIRRLSGAPSTKTGVDLMSFVFAPSHASLVLSDDNAEQEAAHLLFRGVFGFVRNPCHHRMVDDLSRERVVQILGLIDYLLFLAGRARRNTTSQDAGASSK